MNQCSESVPFEHFGTKEIAQILPEAAPALLQSSSLIIPQPVRASGTGEEPSAASLLAPALDKWAVDDILDRFRLVPLCSNFFLKEDTVDIVSNYNREVISSTEIETLYDYLEAVIVATKNVSADTADQTIAVLAPYSRQVELLRRVLSDVKGVEISSIDGFQGREADVVVFVTVRCNEHRDIGFLKDLRRMNVALTRARTALIVIGNRSTLTEGDADDQSTLVWKRLVSELNVVAIDPPKGDASYQLPRA
ncbi:unnamed protein product [Clonostachys chloroleuca]|uniref:DNA2/NAM7 helicase-like C-terminal domain-containing protein n=1 Tax=Clonostachys chloroleuca TaxID=1926264 RepID=A0AA35PXA1_9HYPO|nr:unnamed protein product [Clonostachys chloroleuca]